MGEPRIHVVHHRNGITELVVSGRLGVDAVAGLRRTVHKCAAEMPAGLVLDLNGITAVEGVVLRAVPALQRYCANLVPPRALVVRAAADSLAARALRCQFGAAVGVSLDLESASVKAITAAGPWPTALLPLHPHAKTVGQARRFAHEVCRRWLIPWVGHRVQLVTGELVANALTHAPGRARLTVSLSREWVRVSVSDSSPRLPTARLGSPSPDRGLGVVELASLRWGTFVVHPGKAVWADVSLLD